MEKEFIPYEQALSLKELGFDKPCFACYGEDGQIIIRTPDYRSFETNNESNIIRNFNLYNNGTISAPTFSQAFRFFREKYKLYHEIRIGHDEDKLWWNYYIYKIELGYDYEPINDDNESGVDTYDEAELECLKKLIEIVKQ